MAESRVGTGPHSLAFGGWVRDERKKTVCVIVGGPHGGEVLHSGFVSASRLQEYMTQAMPSLLNEIFGKRHPLVGTTDITPNYLKVFATLACTGWGQLIEYFVQRPNLDDNHFPLESKPDNWPELLNHSSWVDFEQNQWIFFPAKIDRGRKQYENKRIIPFTSLEYLGDGASSSIYKLRLHPDYDLLRNDLLPAYDVHYVLKTYEGRSAKNYQRLETRNFFRLRRSNGKSRDGLINFYASYDQNSKYNIIIEYAEGGSLEDWMKKNQEPKDVEATFDCWAGFVDCLKGLEIVHECIEDDEEPDRDAKVLRGLHQDVCPGNILLKRHPDPCASKFPFSTVLSDLGLSHFDFVERSDQPQKRVVGLQAGETYGAPELYQRSNFDQQSEHRITPSVDIYAMGAVILEFATWVVHGHGEVESFRKRRVAETKAKSMPPGDRFHDGNIPDPQTLDAVSKQFSRLRGNTRYEDSLTGHMLDIAEEMLRSNAGERKSIKHVRQAAEKALDFVKQTRRDSTTPLRDVSAREANVNTRPSKTIAVTYSSPDIRVTSDALERPRQNDRPRTTVPIYGSAMKPPDESKSMSIHQRDDDQTRDRYTEHTKRYTTLGVGGYEMADPAAVTRTGGWMTNGNHRQSQPASLPPSSPGGGNLEMTTSPESYTVGLGNDGHRRDTLDNSEPHELMPTYPVKNATERFSTSIDKSRPASGYINDQPPSGISFSDAEAWVSEIEKLRNYNPVKRFVKQWPTIRNADSLQKLEGRQYIFLIDNGQSMGSNRSNVIDTFRVLSHIIAHYGKGPKIEVRFTTSVETLQSRKPEELMALLHKHDCRGQTDMRASLQPLFNQIVPTPRGSSIRWRTREKKYSLYVLTDGAWYNSGRDVKGLIQGLCDAMLDSRRDRDDFNVQFVRFGDDEGPQQYLQELDDLAEKDPVNFKLDIVDTEYWRNDIVKILLGATMNFLDTQRAREDAAS